MSDERPDDRDEDERREREPVRDVLRECFEAGAFPWELPAE